MDPHVDKVRGSNPALESELVLDVGHLLLWRCRQNDARLPVGRRRRRRVAEDDDGHVADADVVGLGRDGVRRRRWRHRLLLLQLQVCHVLPRLGLVERRLVVVEVVIVVKVLRPAKGSADYDEVAPP